jgi:hypothetical protein
MYFHPRVGCWAIGGYGYWCLHHVGYNASNTTFVQNLNKVQSNQVQQVGILCHTYYYEPHKMHLDVSFRFNLGDHNTNYSSLCHNVKILHHLSIYQNWHNHFKRPSYVGEGKFTMWQVKTSVDWPYMLTHVRCGEGVQQNAFKIPS